MSHRIASANQAPAKTFCLIWDCFYMLIRYVDVRSMMNARTTIRPIHLSSMKMDLCGKCIMPTNLETQIRILFPKMKTEKPQTIAIK